MPSLTLNCKKVVKMEILLKGKRVVAGSFYAGGINDIFMIFSIVKRTTWRWDGCSSGRWRKTASKGHPTDTAAGSSSWPVAVPITHSKFTVLGWTPPAPIDGPIVVERCNQVGNDTTNTKAVTFVLVDRPFIYFFNQEIPLQDGSPGPEPIHWFALKEEASTGWNES